MMVVECALSSFILHVFASKLKYQTTKLVLMSITPLKHENHALIKINKESF